MFFHIYPSLFQKVDGANRKRTVLSWGVRTQKNSFFGFDFIKNTFLKGFIDQNRLLFSINLRYNNNVAKYICVFLQSLPVRERGLKSVRLYGNNLNLVVAPHAGTMGISSAYPLWLAATMYKVQLRRCFLQVAGILHRKRMRRV